jgi:hypothetical protein
MGDMAADAKQALTEATSRLDRLEMQFSKMGTFPAASNESGTQNNATWNVNAGGVAVWIAATACVLTLCVVLVVSVIGGLWLSRELARIDRESSDQAVKIDRANILLSGIWQHAPDLEKTVKADNPEKKDAQR